MLSSRERVFRYQDSVKMHQDQGACASEKQEREGWAGCVSTQRSGQRICVSSCESHTVWFGHYSCWFGDLLWLGFVISPIIKRKELFKTCKFHCVT